MYDNTDPRSSLAAAAATSPKPATKFAGVEYARFHDMPPAEESDGVRTWVTRGQNFVLAYSEASTDCRFERSAQHDEFAVLSPDPAGRLEIEVDRKVTAVPGASLVFMPPGKSTVRLPAGGRLIRLFTMHATDVVALCSNAQSYRTAIQIRMSRRSPPGRRLPMATGCAPIGSMYRPRRAGSAASGAAPPSWSIIWTRVTSRAKSPRCRRTAMPTSSNARVRAAESPGFAATSAKTLTAVDIADGAAYGRAIAQGSRAAAELLRKIELKAP